MGNDDCICVVSKMALRKVILDLDASSFVQYHLKFITDAQSFFSQAKDVLPLDPPISGNVNWDAFVDSLWSGLEKLDANKIAILWHDSAVMKQHDARNYAICIECLCDICESLKTTADGATEVKAIRVFLIE